MSTDSDFRHEYDKYGFVVLRDLLPKSLADAYRAAIRDEFGDQYSVLPWVNLQICGISDKYIDVFAGYAPVRSIIFETTVVVGMCRGIRMC